MSVVPFTHLGVSAIFTLREEGEGASRCLASLTEEGQDRPGLGEGASLGEEDKEDDTISRMHRMKTQISRKRY